MEMLKFSAAKSGVVLSESQKQAALEANALLHSGKGAGNDFLGWVSLPSSIDAEQITAATSSTWADGITTSELAEEAAFAMLSHCPSLNEIYDKWVKSENEFATYAALMALSRSGEISLEQLEPMPNITCRYSTSRPIAQGVVALLAAAYLNPALQEAVKAIIERLPDTPASEYVRDEMSWRMEF